MSDLQTISITIGILTACVSVVIGVINSIQSNREAKEQQQVEVDTWQAELFIRLYDRYSSVDFRDTITKMMQWTWTDYEDFMRKYGSEANSDAWNAFITMQNYFEGVGVLVQRELIDLRLVDDLLWNITTYFWEKFGPGLIESRQRSTLPYLGKQRLFDHTEWLYNRIRTVQQSPVAT
jgi:hypothetical protein